MRTRTGETLSSRGRNGGLLEEFGLGKHRGCSMTPCIRSVYVCLRITAVHSASFQISAHLAHLSCVLAPQTRRPEFVHSLATSDLHVKDHYRADKSSLDEDGACVCVLLCISCACLWLIVALNALQPIQTQHTHTHNIFTHSHIQHTHTHRNFGLRLLKAHIFACR